MPIPDMPMPIQNIAQMPDGLLDLVARRRPQVIALDSRQRLTVARLGPCHLGGIQRQAGLPRSRVTLGEPDILPIELSVRLLSASALAVVPSAAIGMGNRPRRNTGLTVAGIHSGPNTSVGNANPIPTDPTG